MKYVTTSLEDSIKSIYQKMNITDPKQSIDYIARKLGIQLLYRKKFPFSMEGVIMLNPYLTPQKKKEIFAHELYHTLFHVGVQIDMPYLFRQLQEWQASNFAYHFCVPTFMLQQLKLEPTKVRSAVLIAETFNVTYDFAVKRLDMYLRRLESNEYYQMVSEAQAIYM